VYICTVATKQPQKINIMKNSQILKLMYESNIKTWKMLVDLVSKWQDKNYELTDNEWETIKSYKSLLDTYFNDVELIEKSIQRTEKLILNLN
tara:strand:- start:703 stop:978 length:276 start_codon:yes stop_codon:yes gene_type:complete